MRNLTLEGKITVFKTLVVSQIIHLASATALLNSTVTQLNFFFKIIHIASVTVLPNSAVTQLNKIHKEVVWNDERTKIKEKSLIKNFDKKSHMQKIDSVLKICNITNLTLEGKIAIFKTLVVLFKINTVFANSRSANLLIYLNQNNIVRRKR